ncbi:MAG: DUF1540 domain-containing protein [Clostridiales bacterium]|nr:DUF1540 domain-containing protein [Clostridiales bacterium]
MTRLQCNVTSCLHNADRCCCRQAIIVDGHDATAATDTCCGSFDENREGAFQNVFKTPEDRLYVDCEAIQCIYNEGRHCVADSIGISGDGAVRPEQTECATFQMR